MYNKKLILVFASARRCLVLYKDWKLTMESLNWIARNYAKPEDVPVLVQQAKKLIITTNKSLGLMEVEYTREIQLRIANNCYHRLRNMSK